MSNALFNLLVQEVVQGVLEKEVLERRGFMSVFFSMFFEKRSYQQNIYGFVLFQLHVDGGVVCGEETVDQLGNVWKSKIGKNYLLLCPNIL